MVILLSCTFLGPFSTSTRKITVFSFLTWTYGLSSLKTSTSYPVRVTILLLNLDFLPAHIVISISQIYHTCSIWFWMSFWFKRTLGYNSLALRSAFPHFSWSFSQFSIFALLKFEFFPHHLFHILSFLASKNCYLSNYTVRQEEQLALHSETCSTCS